MPRKSKEEKLAEMLKEIDEKKKIAKNLSREIKVEQNKKERKERNHRLIQIGAICEEVYGGAITEGSMQNALRQFLKDQDARGNYYSSKLNAAKGTAAPEVSADGAAEYNQ